MELDAFPQLIESLALKVLGMTVNLCKDISVHSWGHYY